jgi:2-methylcitrate dehydratase PrpD
MESRQGITEKLVGYVAKARTTELPPAVLRKTKHHILDTFAAMISGATLKAGEMAHKFARLQECGVGEAQVVASPVRLPVIPAAIVNGMLGHANETDDTNNDAGMHPGCAILPAAMAMAEREDASGADLIRAVALGYDVGARINKALGGRRVMRERGTLTFSIGGTMGAAVAAGSLAGFTKPEDYRFLLSYAAQQASGVLNYIDDTEHVEKAFTFGGMPARNGVTAALFVQAGFSGVLDVFGGNVSFFHAFTHPERPAKPEVLVAELGQRFEVMNSNIKKYSAGFPLQSPLEGFLALAAEHKFGPNDIEKVVARMRRSGALTVNDSDMPDLNIQYLFAVALLDGRVSFKAGHDHERMHAPEIRAFGPKVVAVYDPAIPEESHRSIVEVTLKDGRTLSKDVESFRGKADNPLDTDEVEAKARDLIGTMFAPAQTEKLIEAVRDLETLARVRDLGRLLASSV